MVEERERKVAVEIRNEREQQAVRVVERYAAEEVAKYMKACIARMFHNHGEEFVNAFLAGRSVGPEKPVVVAGRKCFANVALCATPNSEPAWRSWFSGRPAHINTPIWYWAEPTCDWEWWWTPYTPK